MKRFFRIFAAVALVCTTLEACEEKFDDYDPAAMESTAQVYFSKDIASTIDILEATSVELPVMRVVSAGALDVPVTVTIDDKNKDLFNIPTSVSFADGETATNLVITFDPADLKYGTKYKISFQLGADVITDYGKDLITVTLDYPQPYVSLGKGKFIDKWNFENEYEVEIQQNQIDPTMFRLVDPYKEGIEAEEVPTKGGPSEFVEFRLLKKGEKVGDVTITMDDLVIFNRFNTGYYSSTNGEETALHMSSFKGVTEEEFAHSKVVEWQEADKDGNVLPGIVQLAPYFYYFEAGGGYAQYTNPNIVITFPNYEPKDYSLSLLANGMKVIDGEAFPVVDAIFGADVAQLQMAVLDGHYQNSESVWSKVPALIEAGYVKTVTVDAVDQTVEENRDEEVNRMSIVGAEALPEGIYTAFVIPINEDGEAQVGEIQAVSFYMNDVAAAPADFDFLQDVMLPSQDPQLAEELGVEDDHSTIMHYYEAPVNYVREWKHFVAATKSVDDFLKANPKVTLAQLVKANGEAVDLGYINNDGFDYWATEGLKAETSYTVIDYVVDIYGNVFCQRKDITTAADPKAKAEGEAKAAKLFRMDVAIADDIVLRSDLLE